MRKLWIAIPLGVGMLTLAPKIPLAQMGPGMGMGPAGGSGPQGQQTPAERKQPPSQELLTAIGTARGQGASEMSLEHPVASAPFYTERTFLVLVGVVINRAFRLEGLTREGFAQLEGSLQPEAVPDRNRIFLDEEAAQELRTDGIPMRFLGFCSLKGFPGLHQVHEVLWEAQG